MLDTTATSGLLVVGKTYTITTFVTGDDFENVGAASNASGVEFIATGTTPTAWTNLSTLTLSAIATADLVEVRPDITNYFLHDTDTDFNDEIDFAKRQVQREIRNREQALTGLTGTDLQTRLDTVKDIEEDECLKDKIVLLTISQIFRNNSYLDLASEYLHLANQIELEYTITSSDTEQINNIPVGFAR